MNNLTSTYCMFLIVAFTTLITTSFNTIYGQDAEKHKVRLKADYFKVMNGENYIQIGAIARIDKETISIPNIELTIENDYYDDLTELGSIKTNMKGEGKFIISDFNLLKSDSSHVYNINIKFKGNDTYKKASKSITFKDAIIKANLITKDSINYVSATLIDKATDSVISGESLTVQVKRLFRSLKIGEQFNYTDEKGSILVPVENGIPGVDGILT